jgi:hypothetical protein
MRTILAAGMLALLAACPDGPKIVEPPPQSKSGALHADLPTPPGFIYSDNLTDENPTRAFRVVKQVLKGPNQRVGAAHEFYKGTFPKQGWTLEGEDTQAKGVVRLSFVKKNERCRIEIKDESPTSVGIILNVTRKD